MFLLILSFSIALIWPLKAGLLDRALLAGLCFPLLFIVINIMGLPVHSDLLLDCIASLLLVVAARHYWRNRSGRSCLAAVNSWKCGDCLATLAVALLFLLAIELQYTGNGMLPCHDPIAVPSIARQIFLTGNALLDHFAPGAYHGAYPPGYPILVSLFYAKLGNTAAILAFKHLNILVVACIPIMWAWYLRKLFSIPSALFPLAIAFYGAYFCFDQNLLQALPLAGKNATLFMGLFFPPVLYFVLRAGDSWWAFTAAIAAALALALIHYSAVGMLLIALIAYFLIKNPPWRKANLRITATCLAGYLIVLALFALFLRGVCPHRESSLQAASGMPDFGRIILDITIGAKDKFFFIFNPALPEFQYRGLWLLGLLGAGLIFRRHIGRDSRQFAANVSPMLDLGLFAGVAVVLCIVSAAPLIASGNIYSDYVRWFSFFFYSTLIAAVLALLWEAARSALHRTARLVAGALLLALVLLCACWFAQDYVRLTGVLARPYNRITTHELAQAASSLEFIEQCGGHASLIAKSNPAFADGRRAYSRKTLDYIPAISSLRLATGSWMYAPQPGANDLDDLPSLPALEALWSQGNVYFIGTLDEMRRYSRRLPLLALESFGPPFGALSMARAAAGISPHRLNAGFEPATRIISWRGMSYALKDGIGGVLDAAENDGAHVHISGWAADLRARRVALVVLAFLNKQPLAEMRPQDLKPDVARMAGDDVLQCGFFGIVPTPAGFTNCTDIVAYALYDTGVCYPLKRNAINADSAPLPDVAGPRQPIAVTDSGSSSRNTAGARSGTGR